MAYIADLGNGQALMIENVGIQTVLSLISQSAGQQQSQQMSVSLGEWSAMPMLFKTPGGVIIQIESQTQRSFVRLQSNSISLLSDMPLLIGAETIPLREAPRSASSMGASTSSSMPPMSPMEPMKPMEPLRMGNMEMRMEPMEMKMGDMQLRMGASTQAKFCPQCGTSVKPNDRFCSNCGTKLDR